MDLHIDPEELNACVQCGLCLPHCPTYRVTGDEAMSPRGRIALMRTVQLGDAPVTDEVVRAFDSCVQCLGCVTACPSGVRYGELIEPTKRSLADQHLTTPWWLRIGLRHLSHPRLLRFGVSLIAVTQRFGMRWRRFGIVDRLPIVPRPLRSSGTDVHLFTGCVMDAVQRDVHRATQRVVEATGCGVMPTGDAAPCCGALHAHAGLHADAVAAAERTVAALSGDDRPVLVNSAGCGAAMKGYGELLGTEQARAFSRRVLDVTEWLAPRIDALPARADLGVRIAVQDPCHLRHVQRAHLETRTVLAGVGQLVELDDEGLCCGAGGAYSWLQPELASSVRGRKVESIDRVAPDVVASANPGCSMHLAAAGVPVVHPLQLLAEALDRAAVPAVSSSTRRRWLPPTSRRRSAR